MAERTGDYLSPKVSVRPHPQKGGYGIFADEPVGTGELIVTWSGEIVTGKQLAQLPLDLQQHSLQVEENLYQVRIRGRTSELGDFFNHSCNPNAGLHGQITLVAMRDIEAGEEICFDYAMSDGSPYDEFDCRCGAPNCRGRITGNDWQQWELQERYAGYFSPYLQRRMVQWQKQRAAVNGNGRLANPASLTLPK